MPDLEIEHLCFHNRGPYSLRITSGECVGLQGASGAGKSLLLRAIADLDPRTGRMQLGDINADAVAAPMWRRAVGMLPAESGWWLDLVGDHFANFDTVDADILATVGFDRSVRGWQISRLSTGEKQRLAIVRLLHQQPQCLLLDEPTASLDQELVARVEDLLVTYAKTHFVPVLWVSHDPAQLARVSGRRLCMASDGLLVAAGGPNER
ncbi:MAG: ATP-binding cassette domain-containing protein [Desulfobulbaceae bacterium]|nr:ATP-binding cassette domain-containing protein [Desulfobulbaceae bacterium]